MIKMFFKERIVFVIATFVFFGLFPLILFKMLAFPKANAELKQGVQRNLEGVVNKQKEILTLLWDERKSHARTISDTIQSALYIKSNDDFVSLINERDGHEYLRLKSQLECTKADYGYKGIFVCDGAGIVQIATGDEKSSIGMNIMKEKPFRHIQETLYDGKTYISDVVNFSLTGDSSEKNGNGLPSMFMSSPVKGQNHDVIGAVILWMDTSILSKAMKSVALGKTGEAYLVNKDGVMITESKFSKYVKNANGMDSMSYKVVEPDTQTITKGVEKCITAKISGYDLDGYRDYDGLKVMGAWTWLKDLNMGLIVEIDADEAFGVVNNINSLILPLMVVMIIPAFILATLIYRKLSTGYVLKDMSLPKKATLGVTSILMVGFVIGILDGYELRKERGYLREQKYKVHNPLNVLGSIITQRDEDFIKSNISKFKEELPIFKSENTTYTESEERGVVKSIIKPSIETTVATWELKP
ncbi:MAG: cache domain-containing protein [Planctomycetes bacterium]|nr:cache domain-containing protein [Planctomycetota bacterium]MBI4223101.1 cache domain-containing protein [Planctomycetota bacterium]